MYGVSPCVIPHSEGGPLTSPPTLVLVVVYETVSGLVPAIVVRRVMSHNTQGGGCLNVCPMLVPSVMDGSP
eukprot:COSAG02_NODE_1094_length_14603_cov_40.760549_5_plen_71_part_00